jgi:LEA14-like dessication related protein
MTHTPRLRPLAAALALVALPGCALIQKIAGAAFEKPKLTYESWSAEGLDLDGVTIALHYRLENPNGFGLDLQRLTYRLEVEGRPITDGELPAAVQIKGNGATPIALPVRLRWRELPGFAQTLLTKSDVAYRVSGEAGVGSPVGTIGLPFDHADRVALPRLPSFAVEGITVRNASLSNLALDVRLRVSNGNTFPLPVGALTYGLRVGESDLVTGGTHPLVAVPPGGHATISVPVRVSLVGAATSVAELLRGAEVHLRGLAGFGEVQVPVDAPGRIAPQK